jgi:hypothetical protein
MEFDAPIPGDFTADSRLPDPQALALPDLLLQERVTFDVSCGAIEFRY